MILLDTNVLSEFMGPAPDPRVARWLDRQQRRDDVHWHQLSEPHPAHGQLVFPVEAVASVRKPDTEER